MNLRCRYTTLYKNSAFIINYPVLESLSVLCIQWVTMVHTHFAHSSKSVPKLIPAKPDHDWALDLSRVSKLESLVYFWQVVATNHRASVLASPNTAKAKTTHDSLFIFCP